MCLIVMYNWLAMHKLSKLLKLHTRVSVRVPTGQGKLENVGICVVGEMSGKNIIFEKSGKMILDHADCR